MDDTAIIAKGTRVRCVDVDMVSLNGREPHPTEDDVGFEGDIIYNRVERIDADGCYMGGDEDVAATEPVTENDLIIYTVQGDDGRELKLASHELEVVGSLAV